MYSACLFCQSTLGTNEVIEAFPVGRRLAFDPEKGRLWIVCLHCRQWNLTPLEERWEAVEQCERRFRATRVRVSTEEIGLARLREGLDLVRVGHPLRPEFAAWRYGEQLGRRRRRALALAGAATVMGGAVLVSGAMAGALAAVPLGVLYQVRNLPAWLHGQRVVARVPAGRRWSFVVRRHHLNHAWLHAEPESDAWALQLRYDGGERRFTGHAGVRATSHLMAGVNSFGASSAQVDGAVSLLDQAGDPQRYVAHVARRAQELGSLAVAELPAEVRLAIEMSAHEDAERRALEGELSELRDAWEAAETVASIADDLLLPKGVEEFLRRYRGRPESSR
jgi:hypothetical protein